MSSTSSNSADANNTCLRCGKSFEFVASNVRIDYCHECRQLDEEVDEILDEQNEVKDVIPLLRRCHERLYLFTSVEEISLQQKQVEDVVKLLQRYDEYLFEFRKQLENCTSPQPLAEARNAFFSVDE